MRDVISESPPTKLVWLGKIHIVYALKNDSQISRGNENLKGKTDTKREPQTDLRHKEYFIKQQKHFINANATDSVVQDS